MVIYKPLTDINSLGKLQSDMDRVYDWCNKNELTKNIEKIKAQFFPQGANTDLKQMHQNNPFLINDRKLNYEHTFRYLGIDIDQNLSMKTTCDSIYRNASHKLYIYRWAKGSMTMSAAMQVWKDMFLGVLDYENVFLTGTNKNSLSDLQKLQNDAIISCLKIRQPRDAHVNDLDNPCCSTILTFSYILYHIVRFNSTF